MVYLQKSQKLKTMYMYVLTFNSVIKNNQSENRSNLNYLDVHRLYRTKIENIIMQKHDSITKQELLTWSHRDSKMQDDVGNNKPIKMRSYRTPIRNREVIDKAID